MILVLSCIIMKSQKRILYKECNFHTRLRSSYFLIQNISDIVCKGSFDTNPKKTFKAGNNGTFTISSKQMSSETIFKIIYEE